MSTHQNLVAAIQMTSTLDVAENLAQAERLLTQAAAQGAVVAVLPEMFSLLGGHVPEYREIKMQIKEELGSGPIQDFLAAMAKKLNLWIIAGTLPIKSDDPLRAYAACLVFNAKGEIVAHYDKVHLFDACLSAGEVYKESDNTFAGSKIVVVQTPVGKVGLSVCYDIRFTELYRELLLLGAEILAVPAAFAVTTGKMHWNVLIRALAIQNFCYVIAAGQVGVHGMGRETYGHSMIISPKGEILNHLDKGIGVVTAPINLQDLAEYRAQIPALQHQRIKVNANFQKIAQP